MSILSAIGGAIKTVATKVKDTFLPSVEEGAARRKAVTGSESALLTGGIIVASAAGAIVAGPAAIGAGAVKVVQKVGTSFTSATLKTQATVVAGGLVALGAVTTNPKIIGKASKAPSSLVNFGSNLGTFAEDPTLDNAKTILKENPVTSAFAGALVLGSVGKTGSTLLNAYGNFSNTKAIKENTEATLQSYAQSVWDPSKYIPETTPPPPATIPTDDEGPDDSTKDLPKDKDTKKDDTALSGDPAVTDVPVTPETQVVGKAAGGSKRSRKKPSKKTPQIGALRQSLRVNIFNQGKHLYISRYNNS